MNDYPSLLIKDGFVIFLFHGVIRANRHKVRNYTGKHILLDRFVGIVKELLAHGVPVSMPDIVASNEGAQKLPERAFAVTFDDGFENNYSIAAPILSQLKVPAMFYITTGFVDSNMSSWTDMIEYAIEKVEKVDLASGHTPFHGRYETVAEKRDLLDKIRQLVKGDRTIDPYDFANMICRELGVLKIEPDPELDQKMSWEQVQTLSRDKLFTIGGHSHTHRILEYLDQRELEEEITTSLDKLRSNIKEPIRHYSYPEGLANCYSLRVIRALRANGIKCSPSAEPGVNHVGDDLFQLKRVTVV